MLSESVLIAILAFIIIMCWDQRKWRKSFSHSIRQSSDDYHDLFSQATDHLAFIADVVEDGGGPIPAPAVEGIPSMDPKSILTHLIMSKMSMASEHGPQEQEQIRQISEEKVDPTPQGSV